MHLCIIKKIKKLNIYKTLIYISLSILATQLFISCANIVSPTGGPKDVNPPKILNSSPQNYSTHFNQKKIEITFDEFIVLKELNSQLIISPPFKELPEVKIKGKSLVIDLNENLKENTTYTIFLGDAISDLNEGNSIPSYEFVFSTGNSIDSMSITGKVIDAFTQIPEKDVFVMLYNNNYDSVPYKEIPYYMAKTKENGIFTLNNLKDTSFKIFAIKDLNNNFKFDQNIEKIAFFDTLVTPHIKPIIIKDTTIKDSLKLAKIPKDSLIADSIKQIDNINKLLSINDLKLFQEIDSSQKVLRADFKNNRSILIEFRYPVKNLNYKILENYSNENWKIDEWNLNKDSLTFWLLKPDIDSVSIIVNSENNFTDTLHIYQRKNNKPILISHIKSNLGPLFNFFEKINLFFAFPVLNNDSIPITLIAENDTNNIFAYVNDPFHKNFQINLPLLQNKPYKLIVKENIIKDILENKNDSLILNFTTNSQEDLGNFTLNINAKDSTKCYIIELYREKGELVKQEYIYQNQKIIFKNLAPGNYQIKAIKDKNKNQRWDTGNYLKNIQPEETYFYPSTITIRANWDLEENWIF